MNARNSINMENAAPTQPYTHTNANTHLNINHNAIASIIKRDETVEKAVEKKLLWFVIGAALPATTDPLFVRKQRQFHNAMQTEWPKQ